MAALLCADRVLGTGVKGERRAGNSCRAALCAAMLLLRIGRAAADTYDPFRHAEAASWAMIGWSGACAAASVPFMASRHTVARRAGRQALIWSAVDAALAGVELWQNASHRESGMLPGVRLSEFRSAIRADWMVDFVLLACGVVILQHATSDKARVRGWRWVSRGAVHLVYDMVNYGITYR